LPGSLAQASGVEALFMVNCFFGGPYDGLSLDDYQLSEFTTFVPLLTERGFRVFTLLPPLREWDRVMAGESAANRGQYAYELIITGDIDEFRDAVENGEFQRAVSETRSV
jgi:hypothetical protein